MGDAKRRGNFQQRLDAALQIQQAEEEVRRQKAIEARRREVERLESLSDEDRERELASLEELRKHRKLTRMLLVSALAATATGL